ncbi:MAG: hypothetical protein D6739_04280 [Nitrospirae bacterium]|nr:MAG: hypothetical protein D6739_04280 [Nitrospirota bacterium]
MRGLIHHRHAPPASRDPSDGGPSQPAAGGGGRYLASLDLLRLLAITLVTAQHGLSVTDHFEATRVGPLSMGQLGVALFCALSGFLAFRDQRTAGAWLWRRLTRIYPAYWIVMAASFLLTAATGKKPFDLFQVLSQMAGTGFFTHGWDLVNIVSWFVSLILLCYAVAFVGRATGRPRTVLVAAAAIAAWLLGGHREVSLSRHVLAFAGAGLYRLYGGRARRRALFLGLALLLGGGMAIDPQFLYAAVSLALLATALAVPHLTLPYADTLAAYCYEYFLVHGIFLDGARVALPHHAAATIAVGVLLSAGASVLLKRATQAVTAR